MIRGNTLLENISKLNTYVITTKSNNSLNLYLEKILNNKCTSIKFINDYDYVTLDLLYTSLQIMNSEEKINVKDFNKIDKKELKYYIDKTKGINYLKNQVSSLKNDEILTNYIRTSLAHGAYTINTNNTIRFNNGLIVDAEWLVEFANFIVSSINNNENVSNDGKVYSLKLVEIPEEKNVSLRDFIKNIKLYEYNVSRKDNKVLTYQNIKYIIDILSPIDSYDFKQLKEINSILAKEKYILSINKLNTNFNTEVKSKIEMLLNESDTNYYRLDEYIKDVLKCSNGAYRTNKKKLINTYDLLRSFAHAYKANYKLEECRNLFNLSSKEYEIEFGLTISNFYLNYIYDEENLNKYFNYALLNLEDVKPTIIDYETDEYKNILNELSRLNKKIVVENRKINKYLEISKNIKNDKELLKETNTKIDDSCFELDSLVEEVDRLRVELSNIKDNNNGKFNKNKTKIKYIKESIIKGTYKFDKDTTMLTFDCYSQKDYHHTFHLELTLKEFNDLLLSNENINTRINFYQL